MPSRPATPSTAAARRGSTPTGEGKKTKKKTKKPKSRRARSISPNLAKKRLSMDSKESSRGQETVQVVCRFRPESQQEIDKGGSNVLELSDESDKDFTIELGEGGDHKSQAFTFDKVFKPFSTQEEVYDHVGSPIVRSVMNGYNAAVLAYGQTGSGKTHTMLGPGYDGNALRPGESGDAGILPRILNELFDAIRASESAKFEYVVRASFIEIYRELVKDLLNPGIVKERESLKIRTDEARGIHLPQATEVPINSVDDAMNTLKIGSDHRRTAETGSNARSSRSHSIFLVTVMKHNTETKATSVSQLYCVDLAGSEKVAKCQLERKANQSEAKYQEEVQLRLKEGQKINQSLLALGAVIFALAEKRGKKKTHVPYRNSKLTRLLQNCIGGNARTSMIVCCSPSSFNAMETLSTLRFGNRASLIKNTPKVNQYFSVKQLKAMLKAATQENRRLKEKLYKAHSELKVMQEIQLFEAAVDGEGRGEACDSTRGGGDTKESKMASEATEGGEGAVPSDTSETNVGAAEQASNIKAAVRGFASSPSKTRIKRPGIRELVISFICPLSNLVMIDPVIAMDGYTYDRRAIEGYLRSHSSSPLTGATIQRLLIPNINLKQQIEKYYPNAPKRRTLSYFRVVSIITIVNVFSYLRPRDLGACAAVCQEFKDVSQDSSLWRAHVLRDFKVVNPAGKSSIKEFYRCEFIKAGRAANGANSKKTGRSIGIHMRPIA